MKIGIYVEGRYFGANQEQAKAYALNRSREHMRPVNVDYVSPTFNGYPQRMYTADAGVRPEAVWGVSRA